jgi:hypothetical protein
MKHIVSDQVAEHLIRVSHVHSTGKLADSLTKHLPRKNCFKHTVPSLAFYQMASACGGMIEWKREKLMDLD